METIISVPFISTSFSFKVIDCDLVLLKLTCFPFVINDRMDGGLSERIFFFTI